MATKPTAPDTVPAPLRSNPETFNERAENYVSWQSGPYYDYQVASINYIDEINVDVQAAAVAANVFDLPLAGLGGAVIGVNDVEDGFEAVEITEYAVTPFAESLLDDATALDARQTLDLGSASTRNAESVLTNDANLPQGSAVKSFVEGLAFGVDQGWVDVLASRAADITYQNTTGKLIIVNIDGESSTTGAGRIVEASEDGLTWVPVGELKPQDTDKYVQQTISFPVSNGHYYRVNGAALIDIWSEYR